MPLYYARRRNYRRNFKRYRKPYKKTAKNQGYNYAKIGKALAT